MVTARNVHKSLSLSLSSLSHSPSHSPPSLLSLSLFLSRSLLRRGRDYAFLRVFSGKARMYRTHARTPALRLLLRSSTRNALWNFAGRAISLRSG